MINLYFKQKHFHRLVWAIALSFLLGGCAQLPDLSSYPLASEQLRGSVKASGEAVADEIELAAQTIEKADPQNAALFRSHRDNFAKHWQARDSAMTALVGYAQSLAEIANAGKTGAEAGGMLADSLQKLTDAVGIARSDAVFSAGADTIKFISEQIAKARAHKALKNSLATTGPIMEKIVAIINGDETNLRQAFCGANDAQINELNSMNQAVCPRLDEKGLAADERSQWREILKNRRLGLLAEMKKKENERDEKRMQSTIQDIEIIDGQLALLEPEWAQYCDSLAQLHTRRRLALALIQATTKALVDWQKSHQELVVALNKKQTPTLNDLLTATVDIQVLLKKWREL